MDEFIYLSRKLNFTDSNGDKFIEASKLRQLTTLNFYTAIETGEDNATVCSVLQQDLKSYGRYVDNPKGVNNYADQILDLLPNTLSGDQSRWRTCLTSDKILKYLKPLPCASQNAGKWDKVNCARANPTVEEMNLLKKARENYKDGNERKIVNEKTVELPRKNPQASSTIKPFSEPKGFCPKISLFNRRSIQSSEPKSTSEPEQSKVTKKVDSFKTAGDELRLQNLKKYGKADMGHDGGSCGGTKKSLGTRKGSSIHNKFQPPYLRNDGNDGDNRSMKQELPEEEVDDRLKNIDPKMIELIRNEIMDSGPKLTWDDIAGLEFAKATIQEIVVWPMLRPDIFTGLRRPPKGILLFGPPGTGKTLIGKCIASQSGATFLSISSSSLTSKWVGDGEKMVRALFAVARVYQPSVVFIDEIDSLLSQRSDTEHESSRRIKTEFLVQLDGCATSEDDRILIIGATNRPQELDEAARRRLVKRLYIPLPEPNARAEIIRNLIAKESHTLTEEDIGVIGELTNGYSGADVKHVCQEASLGPIRSIPPSQIFEISSSQVRPVNITDFKSALTRVKSTVSQNDLHAYVTWDKQFGCGSL